MANTNRHIVQKQIFDMVLRSTKDSYAVQQKISLLFKERINPLLDKIFSNLVSDDELVQLDKLEIDVGRIAPHELETVLPKKIIEATEEKLLRLLINDSSELKRGPVNISRFEAYLHFLEHGSLPWQLHGAPEADIEKAVLESLSSDMDSRNKLRFLIRRNPVVPERLVRQSKEPFLVSFLQACYGKKQLPFVKLRLQLEKWLAALPVTTLQKTFYIRGISARSFFLLFWREAVSMALIKNKIPTKGQFVFNLLEKLNSKAPVSPELKEMKKKICEAADPIALLKVTFGYPEIENQVETTISEQEVGKKKKEEWKAKVETEITGDTEPQTEVEKGAQAEDVEAENQEAQRIADTKAEEITEVKNNTIAKETEGEATTEKQQQLLNFADDATHADVDIVDEEDNFDTIPKETASDDVKKEAFTELKVGSAFYTKNAGMVILHPFFKILFQTCDLLDGEEFKSDAAKERAVHLLHFMAGGDEQPAEHELMLPRFLCNLDMAYPIDRGLILTEKEKEEGLHLLKVVIKQWGALGEVGPDSLQEGFLQRKGKLEKGTDEWSMLVEQNTVDILLGQLPWGIGVVKLPWMNELLKVEWT